MTADSRVGFRADLDFGKTADLVGAYEPESDGKEIYKHIQQAYVSVLTGKVQWDVGKFVTPIGAEVIESQDNWNYTRSILFGYAIPFYHTGVRATSPVTDKVIARGLPGERLEQRRPRSTATRPSRSARPSSRPAQLTWIANYMVGKETEDPTRRPATSSTRRSRSPRPTKLSLMGNFDYGEEGDVKWWGVAAYAKLQATAELGGRRPLRVPRRQRGRLHDLRARRRRPSRSPATT